MRSTRSLEFVVLIAALALFSGCASAPPRSFTVPVARYGAVVDATLAKARSLGFVELEVDKTKRVFSIEKICGCSQLRMDAAEAAGGSLTLTFSGAGLFGAFHSQADEIRREAVRVASASR
ncbi:MAG: hypothetical protein JNK60_14205 [Acidobacteria bacterium]|nr:hypothetical protein [Acidobacteriota bacterium]